MSNNIAVVNGATGGIGRAIAEKMAENYDLILLGRDSSLLKEITRDINYDFPNRKIESYPIDVTDQERFNAIADILIEKKYTIRALVNCVGIVPLGGVLEVDNQQWYDAFQVSFMSAVRLVKIFAPLMFNSGGSIVLINGVLAVQPDPNFIISSSITGALRNFAKALSRDLIHHGIRVNSVYPGATKTKLWDNIANNLGKKLNIDPLELTKNIAEKNPMKMLADPQDIAAAVSYFCSPAAKYINGTSIVVDGGAAVAVN